MLFLMCIHVDKARNNFESTRAEVERLMRRIRSAEEDFKAPSCFTMEGYLYIQEKRKMHRNKTLSISFSDLCCEENQLPKFCVSLYLVHSHISTPQNACCFTGPLGSVWTRYYCTYQKSSKMFTMSNTESRPASRQVSRINEGPCKCCSELLTVFLTRLSFLPSTQPFVSVLELACFILL